MSRGTSERQTYGEVEGEVAREIGVENGAVQRTGRHCGVYGLHSAVKTHDEVVEIQAQAQSVGDGQFAQTGVEAKLSAVRSRFSAGGPHIAGVDEGRPFKFPEERTAIFHREVDLQIAGLVDEVDIPVLLRVASGAELSHVPPAHRIGASREVAFLVGDHFRIAEGNGEPECRMPRQRIVFRESHAFREVHIELHILRIRDAEDRVTSVGRLVHAQHLRDAVEEVTGRFHAGANLVAVGAIEVGRSRSAQGIEDKSIGRPHDEDILVRIAEHGIAWVVAFEVSAAEGVGNPRHEHVVQRHNVQVMSQVGARMAIPVHAPRARQHPTVKFRSVLRIVHHRKVSTSLVGAQIALARRDGQRREAQRRFDPVFRVILVAIPLQSADGLVSSTKFEEETLRAAEEIALGIGEGRRSS